MSFVPQQAVLYFDPVLSYGTIRPFSPSVLFSEYPFPASTGLGHNNSTYEALRNFFHLAGMDEEHWGSPQWNPFGDLIRPGQTVLIKPNLVLHENHSGNTAECVYTHASLIRALLDYVYIALRGDGLILVGDAPLQSCRFQELCRESGLEQVVGFFRAHATVPIELIDFRQEHAITDQSRQIMGVNSAAGDPRGYAVVNLGDRSMLGPVSTRFRRFRVTNYDPTLMSQHHNAEKNEYLISRSVLAADVVISMPKMKTHRKAGITGALKNLVGINGHKDWLPHHSKGSQPRGGDEYLRPSICKFLGDFVVEKEDVSKSALAKKFLRPMRSLLHGAGRLLTGDRYMEGSWWGNDTIWRTVLDLNRILIYADKQGMVRDAPQRKVFFLVDGILAGDHEGPLAPSPKPAGVILGGTCAATVDAVMARVMGFDYRKIPAVREAFCLSDLPIAPFRPGEIELCTNSSEFEDLKLDQPGFNLRFTPTAGWQDHIELQESHSSSDSVASSLIAV
jgi:uncharacterized protein (DUF362 family)